MDEITDKDALIEKYQARIRELEKENNELKLKQVENNVAKELYLKIFEDFPALIWRSKLDKLCDYFNRTWLEWTGKTMEEEVGAGWANGIHPEDYQRCLDIYDTKFDKREAFSMEYRLLDRHGEYRWIRDIGRPFYDLDDTFLGYIGSCYDITEGKQNEEMLMRLNATKDKFLRILAHDLRNPIAAFVSISELLMDPDSGFTEDDVAEIAVQMHKDSMNTLHLLENLLAWSKMQSDEISFKPELLELEDLFSEAISQVGSCAQTKKIKVEMKEISRILVRADKNMIQTVLRNLLMNSIKFSSPKGRIHLEAEVMEKGGEGEVDGEKYVVVTVSDHGVGMTEERVKLLFDNEKKMVSSHGTQNEKGSGLGFVLCKTFVERHKGKIWVESHVGKGTKVMFTLPCAYV